MESESEKVKDWSSARTLSIVGGIGRSPSPSRENQRSSTSGMPEDKALSYSEMHLMALADTVASCNVDIAERFAIAAAKSAMSKETMQGSTGTGELSLDSLDDCGLRFLLAMKHYCYLQKCLPLSQRAAISKMGLSTSNIIWGFHSESEDELVSMIPCVARGNPTWTELRECGTVWWVRSNAVLRRLVENLAKASFQKNQ